MAESLCIVPRCSGSAGRRVFCDHHLKQWGASGECARIRRMYNDEGPKIRGKDGWSTFYAREKRAHLDFAERIAAEELNAK